MGGKAFGGGGWWMKMLARFYNNWGACKYKTMGEKSLAKQMRKSGKLQIKKTVEE